MAVEGGDPRKDWPEINRLGWRLSGIMSGIRTLQGRLRGLRRVLGVQRASHPYQVVQRVEDDEAWAETDWRHFRATGGTVNGVTVPAESWTAPEDATTVYVWLEILGTLTGPVFAVEDVVWHHDATGWPSFPDPSAELDTVYVLVAKITLDPETQTVSLRQNVRTDLTAAPIVQATEGERRLRVWGPDNAPAPGVTDPVTEDLEGECCGCSEWGGCTFQQIGGWAMLTGYAPLNGAEEAYGVTTCYQTADVSGKPTKLGLSLPEPVTDYSATITQPRPDEFVGLYPRSSTYWDGHPVVWHIQADRNMPGFSHNPDGYWFYLTNQPAWPNNMGEIHFSNGLGADNGGAAAWREAMYWLDETGGTATLLETDGRSMVTPIGGALPATVYSTTDAARAELSDPITVEDVRNELDARLAATSFPLPEGPGANRIYDRSVADALIHNWQSPLGYNVLKTCQWCLGEDANPDTLNIYAALTVSPGLCPTSHPMGTDFAASRPSCRKAPPGPWWDRSCANDDPEDETNIRYYAIHYSGWVKLDRHRLVEAEHEDMGSVAKREYDEDFPLRLAFWQARIYVEGLAPGQPYIERFCSQSGECSEEEKEAPDCPPEDPECTEVAFEVGFSPEEVDAGVYGYKKIRCLPAP